MKSVARELLERTAREMGPNSASARALQAADGDPEARFALAGSTVMVEAKHGSQEIAI